MTNNQNKEEVIIFRYDDKKIEISKELRRVFTFLMDVEKETKAVLTVEEQGKQFFEYYKDLLNCASQMAHLLKTNNIKYDYHFIKDPEFLVKVPIIKISILSQLIIIFAALEVAYFFYLAYTLEISDNNLLRKEAMNDKNLKKFLNSFILNEGNQFYKDNKEKFKHITSTELRVLRNSLTHFFSIGSDKFIIVEDSQSEKVKNFETLLKKKGMSNTCAFSPNDLTKLLESAHIKMFKIWDSDNKSNPENFRRKIAFVEELVKSNAPTMIAEGNLSFQ